MNNFRNELLKELNQEGVSQKDAEELLQTAFSLSKLSTIRRSYEFKKLQARKISSIKTNNSFFIVRVCRELLSFKLLDSSGKAGFARRINKRVFIPIFAALVLLLVGSSSIVLAQKSLPGETLYPVKRVTEDVIVTFNPVFKEVVFKRRVEENKVIIEKKKVSDEQHRLEEDIKEEEKSEKTSITRPQTPEASASGGQVEAQKEQKKEIEKENKKEEVKNNNVKGEQTERQNSDKENSNENKNKEDDKGEDKIDNSQQKD